MNNKITIPSFGIPTSVQDAEEKIISLGTNMREHAYLIGKYLSYVKENLAHGQFEVWVERKMWFTSRTGRKFIEFSEKCDEEKDTSQDLWGIRRKQIGRIFRFGKTGSSIHA